MFIVKYSHGLGRGHRLYVKSHISLCFCECLFYITYVYFLLRWYPNHCPSELLSFLFLPKARTMAVSFEALAMAGVDCRNCKITIQEWELKYVLQPSSYLLAKQKKRQIDRYFPTCFRLSNFNGSRRVCDVLREIGYEDDDRCSSSTEMKNIKRSMKAVTLLMKRALKKLSNVFSLFSFLVFPLMGTKFTPVCSFSFNISFHCKRCNLVFVFS